MKVLEFQAHTVSTIWNVYQMVQYISIQCGSLTFNLAPNLMRLSLTHSLTLSLLSMHRTDHTPWTVEYLSFSSGRWNDYLWNQLYIIGLYNLHNTFSFLFSLSFINNEGSEKTHVSCLWESERARLQHDSKFSTSLVSCHTHTHLRMAGMVGAANARAMSTGATFHRR